MILEFAETSNTGHVSAAHADPQAVAARALEWLLDSSFATEDGVAWGATRSAGERDPSLYSGGAGIVMALLEGHRHFGDDRFGEAAIEASHELAVALKRSHDSSLYFGVTGIAVALGAVHQTLGDASAGANATHALRLVRDRFDGEGWGDRYELLAGNAGIALGALHLGDLDLAVMAAAPYLTTAEKTGAGVHWAHRRGVASRLHHISHGTLGIVEALAAVGRPPEETTS